MDAIRDIADTIAREAVSFGAGLFPLLMLGLLGLYVLWLVLGYLRVSQVGVHEGHEPRPVVALPQHTSEAPADDHGEPPKLETAPGAPYCAVDGLQYPIGARFCTQCERDLVLDCRNCGATVNASETSCYRCGTSTGTTEPARAR